MNKSLTQEEFINRAIAVHGNKYDYSKTVYVNSETKIWITCPLHGDKQMLPLYHLKGCGCQECGYNLTSKKNKGKPKMLLRKKVQGVGVVDVNYSIKGMKSYSYWYCMLRRCYSNSFQEKEPSYKGCSVCDEWLLFSNFKKWFDKNYIECYALDKDILVKGNKVYSPDTCCFVPVEINSLFVNRKSQRTKSGLVGVYKKRNKFYSVLHIDKKQKNLGYFNSPEDAFNAYKIEKEKYIQKVATEYYSKGLITENVYNALMKYKVEATD